MSSRKEKFLKEVETKNIICPLTVKNKSHNKHRFYDHNRQSYLFFRIAHYLVTRY